MPIAPKNKNTSTAGDNEKPQANFIMAVIISVIRLKNGPDETRFCSVNNEIKLFVFKKLCRSSKITKGRSVTKKAPIE